GLAASAVLYTNPTILVIFARAMNIRTMAPKTAPAVGMLHLVGSSEPSDSAAIRPTLSPSMAAAPTPRRLGQVAARADLVRRARLPRTGRQPRPAARLISTATMKFSPASSKGASGAVASTSPQA